METKKRNLLFVVPIALVGILLFACKKNNTNDTDTTVASDHSYADAAFNEVQNICDQAAEGSLVFYSPVVNEDSHSGISSEKSSCATITIDTISVPHTIVIDFGPTNCLCNDGKNRRGIINVSFTGHYRDPGSVHTITFDNYFVNDNQILGTKTVTNNGENGSGNLTFTIVVDGQIIKANNAGTITFTSNRVREWIEGESTPEWSDDVYLITGTSSGSKTTSSGSTSFTATITTALRRALSCHWFESGVIEVTPENKPVRIINFGNGTCDDQATVTINGNVYNITMN